MRDDFTQGFLIYGVFLFSTVCHEAAHAWSALKLGDNTAQLGGQVSLNPLPHIRREPMGMVVVPILAWLLGGWLFGWASAPYNIEWARRNPRKAALMALSGPMANLLLVLVAAQLINVGAEWHVFTKSGAIATSSVIVATRAGFFDFIAPVLSTVFSLNLLLCLFNLIPLPPLDGSGALRLILPASWMDGYTKLIQTPGLSLVAIICGSRLIGVVYPIVFHNLVGFFFSRLR